MSVTESDEVTNEETHNEICTVAGANMRNLMVLERPEYALDAICIMAAELMKNTSAFNNSEEADLMLKAFREGIEQRWSEVLKQRKANLS